MSFNKQYPLVLIVDNCLLDDETYRVLLQTDKPYMLLHGRNLCSMPADLRWCRSEWFNVCRDISVECRCPVVCCCGLTPDMVTSYAEGFSSIMALCLVSDESTLDRKLTNSVRNYETRERLKVHSAWFRENELLHYPNDAVLDVSGMSSLEEAEAIDCWIRNKLCERDPKKD